MTITKIKKSEAALEYYLNKYREENNEFLEKCVNGVPIIEIKYKLNLLINKDDRNRDKISEECGFSLKNYLRFPKPNVKLNNQHFLLLSRERWQILKKVLGIIGGHELDNYFINDYIVNTPEVLIKFMDGDLKKLTTTQRWHLRKQGYDIPKFKRNGELESD